MDTKPNVSGIYSITHVRSKRRYIGSSKDMHQRWMNHRSKLRGNRHDSKYLQNAWNRYGEIAFVFEVIEVTLNEPTILVAREQYWIEKYSKKLFNCRRIAEQFSGEWYRTEESLETRQNASKRMKDYREGLRRTVICENCKQPWETTQPPHDKFRFCSTKCRNQYRWRNGVYKEERKCVVCDKAFKAITTGKQVACSLACSNVSNTGITYREVPSIIERILKGETIGSVAIEYQVTDRIIRRLFNRDTFSNCPIPEELERAVKQRLEANKQKVKPLEEESVRRIKERLAIGDPQKEIASDFSVPIARVSSILHCDVYRWITMSDDIEQRLKARRQAISRH